MKKSLATIVLHAAIVFSALAQSANLTDQLLETWNIHHRINMFLLGAIDELHLKDVACSKGRDVGEQFAHMHNVRLMWLKESFPELLDGLGSIETESVNKEVLEINLVKSAEAVTSLLKDGFATGQVSGFKRSPVSFLGYLVSHESHIRGQILLILKQNEHMVSSEIQYGIWEWGTR